MASARLSLRLDPALKTWLEEEAARRDRSAGYVASEAIARLKSASEAKRRMIEDAMVEADKGKFVSSEAVAKWMDSWDTDSEMPVPTPDVFLLPAPK